MRVCLGILISSGGPTEAQGGADAPPVAGKNYGVTGFAPLLFGFLKGAIKTLLMECVDLRLFQVSQTTSYLGFRFNETHYQNHYCPSLEKFLNPPLLIRIKDVGSRVHNSILFLWAVGWRKLARMDLMTKKNSNFTTTENVVSGSRKLSALMHNKKMV
ncbi:chromomethylase 2 [Prunus dulcis]|uniref:Chromomethylase 2 n=1 Tax=Prunus dulcis TaxID=3755 RepID=A0A4Y1QQT9_PRUDU|nr:chromomethylase 2 [Prunus dulcis]